VAFEDRRPGTFHRYLAAWSQYVASAPEFVKVNETSRWAYRGVVTRGVDDFPPEVLARLHHHRGCVHQHVPLDRRIQELRGESRVPDHVEERA
jgi:hypothetical protein